MSTTNKNRTVILKYASRHKWGFDRFDGSPIWIIADIDPLTKQFKTGLSEVEQNDLEIKLALPKGTLGPYSEYWKDWYKVIRGAESTVLNLDAPDDFITYSICKNSHLVALSKDDLARKPKAEFYLVNTIEEIQNKVKIAELKAKCFSEIAKMSPTEHKQMLRIMGEKVSQMAVELCTPMLYQKVDLNSKDHDNIGERLQNFYEILTMDKAKFNIFGLIMSGIDNNIITRFKNEYMFEDASLGMTLQEVYKYFTTSEGTKVRAQIEQKINSKITPEEVIK